MIQITTRSQHTLDLILCRSKLLTLTLHLGCEDISNNLGPWLAGCSMSWTDIPENNMIGIIRYILKKKNYYIYNIII